MTKTSAPAMPGDTTESPVPCPFCGGVDLMSHDTWVACRSCGASGPGPSPFPQRLWNHRSSVEPDCLHEWKPMDNHGKPTGFEFCSRCGDDREAPVKSSDGTP
jgi:hypothetical protein